MSTNFPTALDSFINPTATDKLNGSPNPALTHHSQHSNLNDSVSALEAKMGINFSNVSTSIDYALQILELTAMNHARGGYKETVYVSNVFPSVITWYTNSAKTISLLQKEYTYGPNDNVFVTQVVWKLYDGTASNIVKRTITDSITLSGSVEISRNRTIA